jgi:SAM-dependent methyltransferase
VDFIVDPRVETYLRSLDRTADPVLEEMEELARERDFPIVGAQAGKLLSIITRATGARRVLELGSGFGYSAWWFARSLPPGGRVTCTDFSADNRELALGFLARAGLADKVEFLVGDALQQARALSDGFDIVFNGGQTPPRERAGGCVPAARRPASPTTPCGTGRSPKAGWGLPRGRAALQRLYASAELEAKTPPVHTGWRWR